MAKVLLTRTVEDSGQSRRRLETMNHEVMIAPMIEVQPVTCAVPEDNQTLIITSANAARHGLKTLPHQQYTVFCVGEATAQAARDLGFFNVFVGPGTVKGLMPMLLESCVAGSRPFTYLAGEDISYDVVGALRTAGHRAKQVTVYRAVAAETLSDETIAALDAGEITHVLFFSPRTATIFEELVSDYDRANWFPHLTAVGISSRIREVLLGPWRDVKTALVPNEQAMFSLI